MDVRVLVEEENTSDERRLKACVVPGAGRNYTRKVFARGLLAAATAITSSEQSCSPRVCILMYVRGSLLLGHAGGFVFAVVRGSRSSTRRTSSVSKQSSRFHTRTILSVYIARDFEKSDPYDLYYL